MKMKKTYNYYNKIMCIKASQYSLNFTVYNNKNYNNNYNSSLLFTSCCNSPNKPRLKANLFKGIVSKQIEVI